MRLYFLADGAGLLGNQCVAEHRLGEALDLVGRLGEADAAAFLLGALEMALAAAAGVNLGLHHPDRSAQLLRDMLGLGRRIGDAALEHLHAVAGEQLLRLIFVDVH